MKNGYYDSSKRYHIMLSLQAVNILEEDLVTYFDGATKGTIINRIIMNMNPKYNYGNDSRNYDYEYPKQETLKIYLQKDAYKHLEDQSIVNFGKHIKCIIEEYARKTPREREQIIFRDDFEEYNDELFSSERHVLLLETGGMRYDFKLYKLSTEGEAPYNYLIGLSRPHNSNDDYIPASFRVSRVRLVRKQSRNNYGVCNLTYYQKREIDEAINKKGVEYLIGDTCIIKVKFTDAGLKMYNNIIHLRPNYNRIKSANEADDILVFDCTKRQAENYFFKFGKEAIVLEPEDLKEEFKKKYREATKAYTI